MKLVFLYGAPGVGKLTVARELAKITGFRLFHNHLTVDAVRSVFDFGTESFVLLREQIWLAVFREAAQQSVSIIFTFNPERTVRGQFIRDTLDAVEPSGGSVLFAELTCSSAELERRIEDPSRGEFSKLRSVDLFRELQRSGAFEFPELCNGSLSIDTTSTAPARSARLIAEGLSLIQ